MTSTRKKKKKKEKKKDREKEGRKHRHHHKEKRLMTDEEIKMEEDEKPQKALTRLLEQMLHHLQKKDIHSFFANPVNDSIAPGYSRIISQPMDFFTMKSKINSYTDLASFRVDFELICNNAMTYNTVDTIYHKMAQKMLHYGQRLFSIEKLRSMKAHLPFARVIPDECLGIDPSSVLAMENKENANEVDDDDVADVSKVIEDIREVIRRPPGRFEAIPDDMNATEILEQARMAAKGAANRLKIYKPNSNLGFIRQKSDGTTSLKFLTGGVGVVPGTDNDRPVMLGQLIGKVKQGTGTMQGFREDRRNISKNIHPLYYGAFSSHGPSYDSTFANLTKEETDLVNSTYCDPAGVQYAESVLNFSRNCDYAMNVVDHLLDILTGNEHRKTSKYIEEMKALRKEDELLDNAFKEVTEIGESQDDETDKRTDIDFSSLKSLQDEGIDMSFLDNLQRTWPASGIKEEIKEEDDSKDTPQLLQANAQLIEQLKNVQNDRLSATPPPHVSHIIKPSDKELDLAHNIQNNLVEMVGQLKPGQAVPENAVRTALGLPITNSSAAGSGSQDSLMEID